MRFKRLHVAFVALPAFAATTCALAPFIPADPEWKESAVAAPPAFDVNRLLYIESPFSSTLKFGVDPQTLFITPEGVVRYVMVAQGQGGAQNVFYEGIRCNTAEYRLYARHSPEKGWSTTSDSDWQPLKGSAATRHALLLAKAAICSGAAPTTPVSTIVRALRSGVPPGM